MEREAQKRRNKGAILRLTRSENRAYQLRLLEAYPLCQICEEQQSRECHQWCHAHKHESIEKYEEVADENWQRFGDC